jgi:predicted Ser/Thr protein kinase
MELEDKLEDKIQRIVENAKYCGVHSREATRQILLLLDVVGKSEQFTFEDMRNAFDAGAWEHHIHDFDSWIKTQK